MSEHIESLSLEQVFLEELIAVNKMATALSSIIESRDIRDTETNSMREELVKLQLTAQYLEDRLADSIPCRWLREDE